jgi:hypothetical protein
MADTGKHETALRMSARRGKPFAFGQLWSSGGAPITRQWIPAHYSPEEAAAFVLDQFKRTVGLQVAGLEVRAARK